MKTLSIEAALPVSAEAVWEVIGNVTRCDWVPAVDAITEDNGVRSFTMAGIGEVQEKIIRLDHDNYTLQYSAIKTPSPLEHHLATIKLSPEAEQCRFCWTTEIAPDQFAPAIEQGMAVSFEGLKKVLGL